MGVIHYGWAMDARSSLNHAHHYGWVMDAVSSYNALAHACHYGWAMDAVNSQPIRPCTSL